MPFSFWPETYKRKDSHIYELRSYHLKPGTMIEWGNYWARAIRMRDYKHATAYTGMFSQVGKLGLGFERGRHGKCGNVVTENQHIVAVLLSRIFQAFLKHFLNI
jgi:hypothetical protein